MMGRLCLGAALPLILGAGGELPPGWQIFSPKGGGFSVAFPGMPSEGKQEVKTPSGNLDVTLHVLEVKNEGAYVLGLSEFPQAAVKAGSEEKRLDNARDGAVISAKGKLKSEKKIELGGFGGRELVIESEQRTGNVRTRIYAVRNRLYQIMAVGSRNFINGKEAGVFLESFKLNP